MNGDKLDYDDDDDLTEQMTFDPPILRSEYQTGHVVADIWMVNDSEFRTDGLLPAADTPMSQDRYDAIHRNFMYHGEASPNYPRAPKDCDHKNNLVQTRREVVVEGLLEVFKCSARGVLEMVIVPTAEVNAHLAEHPFPPASSKS